MAPPNPLADKTGTKLSLLEDGVVYQSQILAHDTSLARFENLPIGHNYTVSGSYFNGDGVETANVSGDTVFQGVSSESIAPSSTKFIISAGIDFDINSNAPVSGTFKIYDSNNIYEVGIHIASPSIFFNND